MSLDEFGSCAHFVRPVYIQIAMLPALSLAKALLVIFSPDLHDVVVFWLQ